MGLKSRHLRLIRPSRPSQAIIAYALSHTSHTSHTLLCLDKTLRASSLEVFGVHSARVEHRVIELLDYRAYKQALEG